MYITIAPSVVSVCFLFQLQTAFGVLTCNKCNSPKIKSTHPHPERKKKAVPSVEIFWGILAVPPV